MNAIQVFIIIVAFVQAQIARLPQFKFNSYWRRVPYNLILVHLFLSKLRYCSNLRPKAWKGKAFFLPECLVSDFKFKCFGMESLFKPSIFIILVTFFLEKTIMKDFCLVLFYHLNGKLLVKDKENC